MSELRLNPITGDRVIIAAGRAKRPEDFKRSAEKARSSRRDCPFCPGNERETPLETMVVGHEGRRPNRPGWLLRVVPNKFPALTPEAGPGAPSPVPPGAPAGLYEAGPVRGCHEVIIHGPDHYAGLAEMEPEAVLRVMGAYRDRCLAHRAKPEVAYVQIILNHGGGSGASLAHSHSQVFALPFVPAAVEAELKRARAWRRAHGAGSCVFCDLVSSELKGERMVYSSPRYAAFTAFAPRFPFETWVVPRRHAACFEESDDEELGRLGEALHYVLAALGRGLGDPSYNLFLHTSPCSRRAGCYHWHFEVLPRLSNWGGFELAGGVIICTVLPEEAARFLRENA